MWNDPIVEETRKLRDAYAAQFNYDLQAIAQDLRRWEQVIKDNPDKSFKPTGLPTLRSGWPAAQ
jgi:uncharacterized protein (DUF1697 family)